MPIRLYHLFAETGVAALFSMPTVSEELHVNLQLEHLLPYCASGLNPRRTGGLRGGD